MAWLLACLILSQYLRNGIFCSLIVNNVATIDSISDLAESEAVPVIFGATRTYRNIFRVRSVHKYLSESYNKNESVFFQKIPSLFHKAQYIGKHDSQLMSNVKARTHVIVGDEDSVRALKELYPHYHFTWALTETIQQPQFAQ